jgi:hypothetical protein
MKISRFEEIEAWQLARELTRMVYRLTKKQSFMSRQGEPAQPFVDSSTTSRDTNLMRGTQPLNREP